MTTKRCDRLINGYIEIDAHTIWRLMIFHKT